MTGRSVIALVSMAAVAAIPRGARGEPPKGAIAVELSRFALPEENWNRTLQGVSQQTRQHIRAASLREGVTLPPEFDARFDEEFRNLFTYEELIDIQAGLLAKHYTDAEMAELLAFYRTPLGQKSIRITPDVVQDVHGQASTLLQQRIPALMERLKPVMQPSPRDTVGAPAEAASAPR